MVETKRNYENYPIGSLIYFVKKHGHRWSVSFGTVLEHYADATMIQLYEYIDTRLINGTPIKEFETPTDWKKSPKGWSYDTKLFDLSHSDFSHNHNDYKIDNPDDILRAINEGVLVRVQDNDHAHIEEEIDRKKGWRLIRKYPYGEYHPTHTSLYTSEMYFTYEEANNVVKEHDAEFKRQSELSDYEWSVEQIDRTLDKWIVLHYDVTSSQPTEEKEKYREWLLSQSNVEDIETRIYQGQIQWKYWKNKRWMNIEL